MSSVTAVNCSVAHARPCKCYTNCEACQHPALTIHWNLERGTFSLSLWTAVGHCLLSCVPWSKGGFNLHAVIAKTWLLQTSLLSLSDSVKAVNKKHRGYCFCYCCSFVVPLQQPVLSWGRMCLGGMSTVCVQAELASQIVDNRKTTYHMSTFLSLSKTEINLREIKNYMNSQNL